MPRGGGWGALNNSGTFSLRDVITSHRVHTSGCVCVCRCTGLCTAQVGGSRAGNSVRRYLRTFHASSRRNTPFYGAKKKKNGNDRNQPLHLFIKTLPRNRVMAEKNNPHPQSPDRRWEKGTQSVLQNGLFRSSDPIEVHWEHRAGRRGRSGCNQPPLWLRAEVSHAWPGWHDG